MSCSKAVVVGASSGMGLEVAKLLLQKGWKVGVAARRTEPLEELKSQYPTQVVTSAIDVTSPTAGNLLIELVKQLGGMDLYFHAAGVGWQNPLLEDHVEMATVETNGMGFARMVGVSFRYFEENGGGHIAVISSIAGTKGLGSAPAYSATKAFQNTYVEALEQLSEARRLGIRFTDIRPGFVDTPMLAGGSYPMLMSQQSVARKIVRAIEHHRPVQIIDWRFRLLVFFWRCVPRSLWKHMRFVVKFSLQPPSHA